MKKFLSFILLLTVSITVFASEQLYYSKLAAAFQIDAPAERSAELISLMEKFPKHDKMHIARQLKEDFSAWESRENFSRLAAVWQQVPEDPWVSGLCLLLAEYYDDLVSESADCLISVMNDKNFSPANDTRDNVLGLACIYVFKLMREGKNAEAARFSDAWTAKFPDDQTCIMSSAIVYFRGMFAAHGKLPNMPEYENIDPSDFWKSRFDSIAAKFFSLPIKNIDQAVEAVDFATLLHHPKAKEMLRELSAQFPDPEKWNDVSVFTSNVFKDKTLYINAGNDSDVFGLILSHNIPAAKRKIASMNISENFKAELELLIKFSEKDSAAVMEIFHSHQLSFDACSVVTFHAIIASARKENNSAMLETLAKLICSNLNENISGNLANSVGFCAADLGVCLDEAEKLIDHALSTSPYDGAYLDSKAWVLFRKGKIGEAEKYIDSAIYNFVPSRDAAAVILHAAEIKLALGKKDDAAALLERAKNLYDPDSPGLSDYDVDAEKRVESALQ